MIYFCSSAVLAEAGQEDLLHLSHGHAYSFRLVSAIWDGVAKPASMQTWVRRSSRIQQVEGPLQLQVRQIETGGYSGVPPEQVGQAAGRQVNGPGHIPNGQLLQSGADFM